MLLCYLKKQQTNSMRCATYWLSRDPSGEKAGINIYEYCLNSPIRRIDPLGLDSDCTDCKGNPKTGPGVGQKCCSNADPMSGSAPNPYSPSVKYMIFSAQYVFTNGGDGPWGSIVRGCLACMLLHGAGENEAHFFCYLNASQRVPWYDTITGLGAAVGAAGTSPLSPY